MYLSSFGSTERSDRLQPPKNIHNLEVYCPNLRTLLRYDKSYTCITESGPLFVNRKAKYISSNPLFIAVSTQAVHLKIRRMNIIAQATDNTIMTHKACRFLSLRSVIRSSLTASNVVNLTSSRL